MIKLNKFKQINIKEKNNIEISSISNNLKNNLKNILETPNNRYSKGIENIIEKSKSIIKGGKYHEINSIGRIKKVFVIGSSASGKSTVIYNLKKYFGDQISIPIRYITRPQRLNDIENENIYLTKEKFEKLIDLGNIQLQWKKRMEKIGDNWREELFGFDYKDDNKLLVYSGNNGLYNNIESIKPSNIFTDSLIIGVYTPDDIRYKRLYNRSPDLIEIKPREVKYRISDSSCNIIPQSHLILNNYGENEKNVFNDIFLLINYLTMEINKDFEVFRSKISRIMKKPVLLNGKEKIIEYVDRSPGVRILITQSDFILLTQEKRLEVKNGVDYRLPGGKVFDRIEDYIYSKNQGDIGVVASQAAIKELKEETGLEIKAQDLKLLGISHAGATINWDLYYYHADISSISNFKKILTEEGEDIKPGFYHKDEVFKMCLDGSIQEDRTVAILLKYLLNSKL